MLLRCLILGVLAALARAGAAELELGWRLQWRGQPLAVPSAEQITDTGQRVQITRWSALVSGIQLLRADGSVVHLDDQYGWLDAATGRLTCKFTGVPPGEYTGLQVQLGVPSAINHADPSRWAPGHPLNPLVNSLHWSWQGGYVFLAVEGFWSDANSAAPTRGFSYHLATDAQLMTVRFLSLFTVTDCTRVELAFDLGRWLGGRKMSETDGSASTHSASDDPLAPELARAAERALFWLEARALPADATAVAAATSGQSVGRPLAFTIPAGFPQPQLPADNPLTSEGVELGRRLFFDRRLSGNGEQSCASCHDPRRAFSDQVALSRGAEGDLGQRNAQPLFNLAWQSAYAWDGSQPRIRDQALAAMNNPLEMHAATADVVARLREDPRVREDFAAAFGAPEVTGERLGRALEQFLLMQVSADSRFDRAAQGRVALTAEEQRGFELFATEYDPARGRRGADCFHCHGGPLFSDFALKNNGLDLTSADAGAGKVTQRATDLGRFKTPSLRNVALTAPYMHDGRFATLAEVVAHYDHGVQRATTLDPNLAKHPDEGLQLSAEDQRALVAFLRTLTDTEFSRPPE